MSDMDTNQPDVETTLRIPGAWADPGELLQRMPEGFLLTQEKLILPDGGEVEFFPMPPDDQFAGIFRSSCRRLAADDEMKIVDRYSVNIGLAGPGGSLDAARRMMQAGAAIVRAGGAGVFIDNSVLAHGGGDWLDYTEDASPDAVSFAFVSIVAGEREVWTMGMHVLGHPEVVMRKSDLDEDDEMIIELIRYIAAGEKPIGEGHYLGDEQSLRFITKAAEDNTMTAGSPLHNPFGRLKLVSLKEIAEGN